MTRLSGGPLYLLFGHLLHLEECGGGEMMVVGWGGGGVERGTPGPET